MKKTQLDQALTHLHRNRQHLYAAGAHHGRDQELSDELLGLAIEEGIRADRLRGELTWDEVLEQLYGGDDD